MTTKPLVIYHQDCQDGYAAAFSAWLKLGDDAEYLPVQYGKGIKWNENSDGLLAIDGIPQRDVYILDFSFPREVMDLFFAKAKHVVWLDHHKSAFEMWCPYPYEKGLRYTPISNESGTHHIVLDDNKSGCILAWEYFHPNTEIPMLFRHIDDRDRWEWKMEGSAEIHAALAARRPWEFEDWEFMVNHWDYDCETPGEEEMLNVEGTAILSAQEQHIEQMLKQARKCIGRVRAEKPGLCEPWEGIEQFYDYADYQVTGLACNSQLHASELGHALATTSGTFGLVWYLSGDNRVKCSFRSNGDYDVSAIAKAYKGGGHKNAAGCEISIEVLLSWLR